MAISTIPMRPNLQVVCPLSESKHNVHSEFMSQDRMKSFIFMILLLSLQNVVSFSLLKWQLVVPSSTKLYSREIMSNMDIMCLENAADICSYYDNCDLDEREALLNRFEEQTELMVDKVATMTALVKHLKTGDHKHVEDDEVATLRNNIFALLNNSLAT